MRKILVAIAAFAMLCGCAYSQSAGLPDPTAVHVVNGVADRQFELNDGTTPASQQYVLSAIAGNTGGTGITQQYLYNAITTGSTSGWGKICWVGSSQCSGGVGTLAPATAPTESFGLNTPSASTGTSNSVAHFQLQVPTAGGSLYTQALWVHSASGGTADAAVYYTRDAWFKIPSMPAGKVNIEFDYWPVVSGWLYMFGTQCAGADGYVMEFDNQGHGWVHSTLSCSSLVDGNWHHIQLTYHRDPTSSTACSGAPCEYWDTVTLDGVAHNWKDVNGGTVASLPATSTTWGDGTGSQWQLDAKPTTASSGSPAVYDFYVDTDTVTASVSVASQGNTGSPTVNETQGNLGEYDFDGANPTAGLTSTGTPTLDNTTVFTSPNAMLFNAASEYEMTPLSSAVSTLYGRLKININASASGNARVFEIDGGTTGNTQIGSLFLQGSNGFLTFSNTANTTSYACASAALSTGAWHLIEWIWVEGASTGSMTVSVDGTQTCNVTGLNTGTNQATYMRFGQSGTGTPAWTYDLDNVGFSSTGPLGDVTVSSGGGGGGGGGAPLYDIYGAAAQAVASSLQAANNLSDVVNKAQAVANLGLGSVQGAETLAYSATPTFSLNLHASYMVLTGNVTTFTMASGVDGQSKTLAFCQDSTGGRTVTAPANVHGFMNVSAAASTCSVGRYVYFATPDAWFADSAPVVSQLLSQGFGIAIAPSTLLYEPTMSGTQTTPAYTVTQSAIGTYTGTASYTASSLASGMSAAFSPSSITGSGTSSLTLSFPYSQTPATTAFTVQGSDGTNTHTSSPSITVGNINQGMVECWPMTDGSGVTLADGCGTSNTETLAAGTLTWGSHTGLPGSTPLFSSVAYMTGANQTATNFSGSTPFSVAMWIDACCSDSTSAFISTLDTASNDVGWELGVSSTGGNSTPYFYLINAYSSSNYILVKSSTSFAGAALHYLVVTYDGSKSAGGIVLYLDGVALTNSVQQNTLTGSIANTKNAALGGRVDGTLPASGAAFAYMRLYNRVLSSTDVANYYPAGAR